MPPAAEPGVPAWAPTALIILLALLGGLAGVLAGRAWLIGGGDERVDGRPPAPPLQLVDLDGQRQQLTDLRGQAVLVNFWATWCPPCVKELPLLQQLHGGREQHGLAVLTIAQEDDPAAVRAFLAEHAITLPAWLDPPSAGDASWAFGNRQRVLPYSVLIDADGRLLARRAGQLDQTLLDDWQRRIASAGAASSRP